MKVLPFTIPTVDKASFLIQEDHLKSFYPHLHRHKEIQICWIKKGRGTLIVKADFYAFKEDDIFIIASNSAHIFRNEDQSDIECITIFFNVDSEKNMLMKLEEMKDIRNIFSNIFPCHRLDHFISTFIDKLLFLDGPKRLALFMEMLVEISEQVDIDKESKVTFSDKSGDRMKKVIEYTISHYKENIEIKNLANYIYYTPEAFCRFFKRRTGKTYIKYLNEYRVNEVCRLLIAEETPEVGKIAYSCGFNNISHFNRIFKQQRKCSPLQYRNNYLASLGRI